MVTPKENKLLTKMSTRISGNVILLKLAIMAKVNV